MTQLLEKWKVHHGFNYVGWKMVVFKRWLRHNHLGWLIPFNFIQEDYGDGLIKLCVWRWGVVTWEAWKWSSLDQLMLARLQKNGMLNKRQLYIVIMSQAVLVESKKTWQELRGSVYL